MAEVARHCLPYGSLGTLSKDGSASAAPGEPAASGVCQIGKPKWLLCAYTTNCLSGLGPLWEHAPIGGGLPGLDNWELGLSGDGSLVEMPVWRENLWKRKRDEPCGDALWQETL